MITFLQYRCLLPAAATNVAHTQVVGLPRKPMHVPPRNWNSFDQILLILKYKFDNRGSYHLGSSQSQDGNGSTSPCANPGLQTKGEFWEVDESLLAGIRSVEGKGLVEGLGSF